MAMWPCNTLPYMQCAVYRVTCSKALVSKQYNSSGVDLLHDLNNVTRVTLEIMQCMHLVATDMKMLCAKNYTAINE